MSVYTTIEQDALTLLLSDYELGALEQYEGIEEGIENTNYFVTTNQGEFVLTIFEQFDAHSLEPYLVLGEHYRDQGLPCATLHHTKNDKIMTHFAGKPATIFSRLPGHSLAEPDAIACWQAGQLLARLHGAKERSGSKMANRFGLSWMQGACDKLAPFISASDRDCLQEEIEHAKQFEWSSLPSGFIHADLFPDNVLFQDGKISGVIDFYMACFGCYIYDLAITINAWCRTQQFSIDQGLQLELIKGYESIRSLSRDEIFHLNNSLRLSAVRYWISRLEGKYFPPEGDVVCRKDPDQMRSLLLFHREA